MRDTIEGLFPGCGSDPAMGIDEHEAERREDRKLRVDFYKATAEDYIPTHGGYLDVNETPPERIEELKALGCKMRKQPKEPDLLFIEKCGRVVLHEVEFIRISRPGDRDLINERPVTEEDKQRFPEHWKRHVEGADAGVVGTPLTEMPFINVAMREELNYFGVITGEQLVGMSDVNAGKFPYMSALRPRVQRYLDAKAADAPFKARDARTAALEDEVKALQAQLAAMAQPSQGPQTNPSTVLTGDPADDGPGRPAPKRR